MRVFYYLFVLLSICLFGCYGQVVYTIGITPEFSQYFSTFNDVASSAPSNITVNIVNITIPSVNNYNDIQNGILSLAELNVDYVIGMYSLAAGLITFNMKIPYFFFMQPGDSPDLQWNSFSVLNTDVISANSVQSLLQSLGATDIVYIDYAASPTTQNLMAYSNFRQSLFQIDNTTNPDLFLTNNIAWDSIQYYVCAVPLVNTNIISNILQQAQLRGQLRPGKVWIFSSLTIDESLFQLFTGYTQVVGTIYGIGVNFTIEGYFVNNTVLFPAVARDLIRLIIASVVSFPKKPTNTSDALLQTTLLNGEVLYSARFQPGSHSVSTTAWIKHLNNKAGIVNMYTYNGTLGFTAASTPAPALNTSVIRIAVILSKGYFMKNSNNSYYGYSVGFLQALNQLSTFQYTYVFPSTNVTGELINNQGIIGLLMNNKADMTIIPMVVDYIANATFNSDVIAVTTINLVTRPMDEVLTVTGVLIPFTYNVWIAIIIIFIIMSFCFFLIDFIKPNFPKEQRRTVEENYTIENSFLIIYSSFVMAKLKIRPQTVSTQIFAFILWFSTLTFVITYSSNLLPFYVQPKSAYPFSNGSDLLGFYDTWKWGFVQDSVEIDLVLKDTTISMLYNISVANWSNRMLISDYTSDTLLQANGWILIQNSNKNGYIYNTVCRSDIITGSNKQYSLVIAMNPNWVLKNDMKNLIATLIANGQMSSLVNIYFATGVCANSQDSVTPVPKQLTLNATLSLFLLPIFGVFLGLLFVFCRSIKYKIIQCLEYRQLAEWKFGEVYEGQVHSLENDGAWIFMNGRTRPYYVHSSNLHPDIRRKSSPEELGIKVGDKLKLKYFGRDPITKQKKFCRDISDQEDMTDESHV